jgi:hypothetical protein
VQVGLKPVSDKFKIFMIEMGRDIIEKQETHNGEKELSVKDII